MTLVEIARGTEPKIPHDDPDLSHPDHAGQLPAIWPRAQLFSAVVLAVLLTAGVLQMVQRGRDQGEPLPNYSVIEDNQLNDVVAAFSVVTDSAGKSSGLVAADDRLLHYGETVKNMYYWSHVPLADVAAQLPAQNIVGISATTDLAVLVCEDEAGGCRGLTLGKLGRGRLTLWPKSPLDSSCFPGLDDQQAHCLLPDPATGLRLVGGPGIGLYDPLARSWVKVLLAAPNSLASSEVWDLERLPQGRIAVMGNGGIDFGTLTRESASADIRWVRSSHFDRGTGLVSDDIRHGRLADGELLYITGPGGLGGLAVDGAGAAGAARMLVGEGRAPGLTRESLRCVAEDRDRSGVWMVHQADGAEDKLAAALYRTDRHEMLATPADAAWPASTSTPLAADPAAPDLQAWAGGRGIRRLQHVPESNSEPARLDVQAAGLDDRDVDEIAVGAQGVVAHTLGRPEPGGDSAHTVEAATRTQLAAADRSAWSRPLIGPRRFPGLTTADLTTACDGQFEGQPAVYFGTQGKGIAAFLRDTRELCLAHHSQHPEPQFKALFDDSLDLAACGAELAQVGLHRTLAYHNGADWTLLIAEGGVQLDPADVKTVAGDSKRLLLGTARKIACYDVATHNWSELTPVPDLERLAIGIERIWAIDKAKRLFSHPFPGTAGGVWTKEDDNILDFYADADLVAVIGANSKNRFLWTQTKAGPRRRLVEPKGLTGQALERWSAAALTGGILSVAPFQGQIGQYNLADHAWTKLELPDGYRGQPRQLVATVAGLWLLGSDDVLYFLKAGATGAKDWAKAVEDTRWLGTDGVEVIVLTRDGGVQRSAHGGPPMATLVGDAFADSLTGVRAAAVFQGQLFVGTAARAGRYEVNRHAWHSYDGAPGIVQFAHTIDWLYALTGEGRVQRWVADGDAWEAAPGIDPDVRVTRLAARGGPALFLLLDSGAVLTIIDAQPENPRTLLAASRLGKGGITAGAELGRELLLGLDDGRVAGYSKTDGQPWTWTQVLESPTGEASPIRQLLVASADPKRAVAVGARVSLLQGGGPNQGWATRTLLDQDGIFGAADGENFFGLQDPGGAQAQIHRVGLNAAPPSPVAYIGAPFPAGQQPETVAVGAGPAQELFRVDADGTLAQYMASENAWKRLPIGNVRQFFRVGQQLWAWAPAGTTLYRWQDGEWKAADADHQIEHVAGDGQSLLLARAGGEIVLRTERGDTTLVAALPAATLPLEDNQELAAAAELGDWLFLVLPGGSLLSYNRAQHAWRIDTLRDVVEFCLLTPAEGEPALFARTAEGNVHRYDTAASTWSKLSIPEEGQAAKLVAANRFLALQTTDSKIYLADAKGQIAGSFQPRLLNGRKAADFKLRAAAESAGKLYLVPESGEKQPELWRYDPDTHAWTAEVIAVPGSPQRFLEAGGLWLVLETPEGLRLTVIGGQTPLIEKTVPEAFLDVDSDGKSLWALSADHHLCHVDRQGQVTRSGVPEVALPDGRRVHRAFAIADQCGVLLDDGSVYHYTRPDRHWVQRIGPLPNDAEFKGQLVRDEERQLLLVRPKEEIWVCDAATGIWEQLPKGQDITKLPPVPPQIPAAVWQVEGQSPAYTYAVQVGGLFEKRTLEDGRFDWDLPNQVVVAEGAVWLRTPGGPRKYRQDPQNVWREVLRDLGDYPEKRLEPLEFSGIRFACRRDAQQGAFATASTPVALQLNIAGQKLALRPGDNAAGAGFAHDISRDLAAAATDLFLATAGGVVRLTDLPKLKLAGIAGADQGLPDEDCVALRSQKVSLFVKSQSGTYAGLRSAAEGGKWQPLSATVAEFFRPEALLERCNEWLQHWQLTPGDQAGRLHVRLGNVPVAVSLGPRGFGFDHPQAFSWGPGGLRFWSVDGLAELPPAGGPLTSLAPRQRVPAFSGFADLLDDPATGQAWLRQVPGAGGEGMAWRFAGEAWGMLTTAEYDSVLAERQPWLCDTPAFRWDRRNRVTFTLPILNQGRSFTTQFDAGSGRFLLNIPHDIAVFNGELWAVTAGGVVRYDKDRLWAEVSPPPGPGRARLHALEREKLLAVEQDGNFLRWNGQAWEAPADLPSLLAALARRAEYLVDGEAWQILRADAQTMPRRMQVRLLPQQPFQPVVLGTEGLFDFEMVHDLVDDGTACIAATEFGLVRTDVTTVDFTHLWHQGSAAKRVGHWEQKLFAQLASGQVLEYQDVTQDWLAKAGSTVFDEIDRHLLKVAPWTWLVDGEVHLQAVPGGIWEGNKPLPVGLVNGRFDFDTVFDVGHAEQPWLVTAAGLLVRQGAGFVSIGVPIPFTPAREVQRSLISYTQEDLPLLFARTPNGLLQLEQDQSSPAPPNLAAEVLSKADSQVARSSSFDVVRGPGLDLVVSLHLPEDHPGQYKPVAFDPELGMFTFDDLRGVTRLAGDSAAVLVATGGGIAKYLAGEAVASTFQRLFCESAADGIDSGRVVTEGLLLAKREPANLLLARDKQGGVRQGYFLDADRWRLGNPSDQLERKYALEQRTLVFDRQSWQVVDKAQAAGEDSSLSRFDMRWRGDVVRLAGLNQERDSSDSRIRFAHDIPLSAAFIGGDLWLGTRGGVVRFPVQRSGGQRGRIDLADFDLHADATLTAQEISGSVLPQGVVLVRAGQGDFASSVFARQASGGVLHHAAAVASAWDAGDAESAEFRSVCRAGADSSWAWIKDSLAPLRRETSPDRFQIPADYPWLTNGTWSFLETGHVAQRTDPVRTMVFYHGDLFLATAGGVARFAQAPAATAELGPVVDAVYALAADSTGKVPLPPIVALFHDPSQDLLYARSDGGERFRFDAANNVWCIERGARDPFADANVVVDNALLQCSLSADGWRVVVRPLLADMDADQQTQYQLFSDGRFSFDCVRAFVTAGERLWLATDGGVCVYSRSKFRPERFYASAFAPRPGELPGVAEVVTDPADPARILCRCRWQDGREPAFAIRGDRWEAHPGEAAFLASYERDRDGLMSFIQYPAGILEARLLADGGTEWARGTTLGTRRRNNPLPLFGHNRFSFDDVRSVAVSGEHLLAATAAGLVQYHVDWDREVLTTSCIRSWPGAAGTGPSLARLTNIAGFPDGQWLAWSDEAVFLCSAAASPTAETWNVVPDLQGVALRTRMLLPGQGENWILTSSDEPHGMRRFKLSSSQFQPAPNDQGETISNWFEPYQCQDASTAVMDEHWIYQRDERGGLIRIPRS